MSIRIGLSFTPNHNHPPAYARQHAEGLRILAALDQGAAAGSPVQTEASGRPYFAGRHADFSISHSYSMAAVSYSAPRHPDAGEPLRTGCDLQYVRPGWSFDAVAKRFFAPAEREYIRGAETPGERSIRFYRIWTLKECFIKLKGLSIADIKRAAATGSAPVAYFQYAYGGGAPGLYILTAAVEHGSDAAAPLPPEPRWFSPAHLPRYCGEGTATGAAVRGSGAGGGPLF
jgi:phosphopantetheinyl transferase